jgi:hypothetical protein
VALLRKLVAAGATVSWVTQRLLEFSASGHDNFEAFMDAALRPK